MTRLANKKALVTAAGQGIGRAAALAFCREGATVVATDICQDLLTALANDDPRLDSRPLDVRDRSAIQDLAREMGSVDILLNCAGMVHQGTILDCSETDWSNTMELNVTSMYYTIREFLPAMLSAGGGSIINISSVASSLKGFPNRFAYSASKAAVIGLTKSIAVDFVTQGIRCNAICPGTVQSPSFVDRMKELGDVATNLEAFVARQPMQRLGRPEEIAELAVYLASDESTFTTGAVHIIDGGCCI